MKKKSGIDPIWLTLGCLIGFTTAALVIVGLKISVDFIVLQKYQDIIGSLVGGILALGAAVPTIWIIQRQIQQTKNLDDERRERRDYATRSVLPHMLVKIIDYSEHCVSILLDLHGHNDDVIDERWSAPEGLELKIPELPTEVVMALRENIEVTLNQPAREAMRLLLEKLQVQRSRFDGYLSGFKNKNTLEPIFLSSWEIHIWDAIEIYALSSKLLDYARLEKDVGSSFSYTRLENGPLLPLSDYVSAAGNICNCRKPDMSKHVKGLVTRRWNQSCTSEKTPRQAI